MRLHQATTEWEDMVATDTDNKQMDTTHTQEPLNTTMVDNWESQHHTCHTERIRCHQQSVMSGNVCLSENQTYRRLEA